MSKSINIHVTYIKLDHGNRMYSCLLISFTENIKNVERNKILKDKWKQRDLKSNVWKKINISNEYNNSFIRSCYLYRFMPMHMCVLNNWMFFLYFWRNWITEIQYVFKSNTEDKLKELDKLWEKSKSVAD